MNVLCTAYQLLYFEAFITEACPFPFKGTLSRDGYFFEGLNILISTFCECADDFQGLSKAFHYPVQLLTFYFASLKLLTNFENAY